MGGMRRGAWYAQAHVLDQTSAAWEEDDADAKARPTSAGSTVGEESSQHSSFDFEEELGDEVVTTPRAPSRFARRLADALHISQVDDGGTLRSTGSPQCMHSPRRMATFEQQQHPPPPALASAYEALGAMSPLTSPRRLAKWMPTSRRDSPTRGEGASHQMATPPAAARPENSPPRPPTRRVFSLAARPSREQ